MLARVGITGASGTGVTTLERALAARLDAVAIDTDDHYWLPTDPPYRKRRPVAERLAGIAAQQGRTGRWVIGGTIEGWCAPALEGVELVVFLEAPTELRMARLLRRERERFGDALLPGGAMHETHREFIAWAARYEAGTEAGRSRPRQERWLAGLDTPVLRLDGGRSVAELVAAVLAWDGAGRGGA